MNKKITLIYLVDDDEDDRLFFSDAFSETEYNPEILTFDDGYKMLEALETEQVQIPQIIFLDLNMPHIGGLDCLKKLKKNKKFDDVAVAIYSTSAAEKDIGKTFKEGASLYIKKQSSFSDIVKTMNVVLTMNWNEHQSNLSEENFVLSIS